MFLRTLALAATLALSTAAAAHAANVKTDYDHSANFSALHSYTWGQVTTSDPFYVDRIKQEVDRDLQAKGWQLMPSGGDATVFVTGNVQNQQQLETTYAGFGPGWGGGWGWGRWGWGGGGGFDTATTQTVNQPVGHLVLDIFGQNKQLLFRGLSTANLKNNADKNTKELDKDIDDMLKKFPPKS